MRLRALLPGAPTYRHYFRALLRPEGPGVLYDYGHIVVEMRGELETVVGRVEATCRWDARKILRAHFGDRLVEIFYVGERPAAGGNKIPVTLVAKTR